MKRRFTHCEPMYEQQQQQQEEDNHCVGPPMNDVTARMISSSVGSVVTSLAVTPLDVAKVRIQNYTPTNNQRHVTPFHHAKGISHCGCGTLIWKDSSSSCLPRRNMSSFVLHSCYNNLMESSSSSSSSSSSQAAGKEANTTWLMLRKIWLEEGFAGLYRGIRPTLIMAVPNTMLYYTCYDELVQHVRQGLGPQMQVYAPLLSGGTARLLASSATAPLEYMRTREASLSGPNNNNTATTSLRQLIRTQGFKSLYRGLAPTLWRDVPFSAIYWLVIEELRLVWKRQGVGSPPTNVSQQFVQSFVNGLIAGTISACCTTPFDVLKTRQQSAAASNAAAGVAACNHNGATPFLSSQQHQQQPAGTLRALQQLARTEGVAGLWRGNWARVAKVTPSCAIMISSYEVGKRLLLVEESS